MELSIPSSPAHLADLRRSVRAGLQGVISDRDLDDILLAVNEAATNAMLYGSGAGQHVEVVVRVEGGWAEVTVLDRGAAGRGGRRDDAQDPDAVRHGGRGLWLMGRLVDEVRLERVESGTRITLRRRLATGSGG